MNIVLDENFETLMSMPPAISSTTPATRNAVSECEVSFPVSLNGVQHPIVPALAGEAFGEFDTEGKIVPYRGPARLLMFDDGDKRLVYRVVSVKLDIGATRPNTMTVYGVDLMDYLAGHPCPSRPISWQPNYSTRMADYVTSFSKPRDLADIKLAKIADGFVVEGDAETAIRRVIRDSIEAVNRQNGWTRSHMVVAPNGSGLSSPRVSIRTDDQYLLDTVAAVATNAGVDISARLWLPGDAAVSGLNLTQPVIVIEVRQTVEVSNA